LLCEVDCSLPFAGFLPCPYNLSRRSKRVQSNLRRRCGTISGTVKWTGPSRTNWTFRHQRSANLRPGRKKSVSLERLIVGPRVVSPTPSSTQEHLRGKAMELPSRGVTWTRSTALHSAHSSRAAERRVADAKLRRHAAHHPHGRAATFNLPFPFPNQIIPRTCRRPGLVNLHCNGGHVWMNAEMMVAPHPYYAVTDESGRFEFTGRPARHLPDCGLA